MLALHVLKQRERLAQGSECVLDAGLAVDLRRGVLRLEQGAHRLRDVLRNPEDLFRDVRVLLERL
jgi:hypothetical protein